MSNLNPQEAPDAANAKLAREIAEDALKHLGYRGLRGSMNDVADKLATEVILPHLSPATQPQPTTVQEKKPNDQSTNMCGSNKEGQVAGSEDEPSPNVVAPSSVSPMVGQPGDVAVSQSRNVAGIRDAKLIAALCEFAMNHGVAIVEGFHLADRRQQALVSTVVLPPSFIGKLKTIIETPSHLGPNQQLADIQKEIEAATQPQPTKLAIETLIEQAEIAQRYPDESDYIVNTKHSAYPNDLRLAIIAAKGFKSQPQPPVTVATENCKCKHPTVNHLNDDVCDFCLLPIISVTVAATGHDTLPEISLCPRCDGSGRYGSLPAEPESDCVLCNGTGRLGPDGEPFVAAPTQAQGEDERAMKAADKLTGVDLIAAERQRQIAKGFNSDHDREHDKGEIAEAAEAILHAVAYPLHTLGRLTGASGDPRDPKNWHIYIIQKWRHEPIRMLTIAAALIAAEIDRMNEVDPAALIRPFVSAETVNAELLAACKAIYRDCVTSFGIHETHIDVPNFATVKLLQSAIAHAESAKPAEPKPEMTPAEIEAGMKALRDGSCPLAYGEPYKIKKPADSNPARTATTPARRNSAACTGRAAARLARRAIQPNQPTRKGEGNEPAPRRKIARADLQLAERAGIHPGF